MIVPAHAEPAVVSVFGHGDRYLADQAWIFEGMIHALGRWEHKEGANNSVRRLYAERAVRSWPTRHCTVEWSPVALMADVLMDVAA